MHAEIEFLSGVIRVWIDGKRRPDPWDYAATLRWINPHTVEVMAVKDGPGSHEHQLTALSMAQVRAMAKALYASGVTDAFWTRYEDGAERRHHVDVRRWAMK